MKLLCEIKSFTFDTCERSSYTPKMTSKKTFSISSTEVKEVHQLALIQGILKTVSAWVKLVD